MTSFIDKINTFHIYRNCLKYWVGVQRRICISLDRIGGIYTFWTEFICAHLSNTWALAQWLHIIPEIPICALLHQIFGISYNHLACMALFIPLWFPYAEVIYPTPHVITFTGNMNKLLDSDQTKVSHIRGQNVEHIYQLGEIIKFLICTQNILSSMISDFSVETFH